MKMNVKSKRKARSDLSGLFFNSELKSLDIYLFLIHDQNLFVAQNRRDLHLQISLASQHHSLVHPNQGQNNFDQY